MKKWFGILLCTILVVACNKDENNDTTSGSSKFTFYKKNSDNVVLSATDPEMNVLGFGEHDENDDPVHLKSMIVADANLEHDYLVYYDEAMRPSVIRNINTDGTFSSVYFAFEYELENEGEFYNIYRVMLENESEGDTTLFSFNYELSMEKSETNKSNHENEQTLDEQTDETIKVAGDGLGIVAFFEDISNWLSEIGNSNQNTNTTTEVEETTASGNSYYSSYPDVFLDPDNYEANTTTYDNTVTETVTQNPIPTETTSEPVPCHLVDAAKSWIDGGWSFSGTWQETDGNGELVWRSISGTFYFSPSGDPATHGGYVAYSYQVSNNGPSGDGGTNFDINLLSVVKFVMDGKTIMFHKKVNPDLSHFSYNGAPVYLERN